MKTNPNAVQLTANFCPVQECEVPLVAIHNGVPMTSSLQVAQRFGKDHKDILRAIRSVECSTGFQERNFALSFYINDLHNDGQKKQPLYYMTRDGFTFLVMGFTGKIAPQFKEDYINAFNQMENVIKNQQVNEAEILKALERNCEKLSASLKSRVSKLTNEANKTDMP